MNIFFRLSVLFLCIFSVLVFLPHAVLASAFTAEFLFREVPADIFENTAMPLTEKNKELLLDQGYCEGWIIKENFADSLVLSSTITNDDEVKVQVFRSNNGGVAVVSAQSGSGCTSELWEFNPKGGLVPYTDMPATDKEDYLAFGRKLPDGLSVADSLCLEKGTVVAIPSFWDDNGSVEVKVDKGVRFLWNGTFFNKVEIPTAGSNPN